MVDLACSVSVRLCGVSMLGEGRGLLSLATRLAEIRAFVGLGMIGIICGSGGR